MALLKPAWSAIPSKTTLQEVQAHQNLLGPVARSQAHAALRQSDTAAVQDAWWHKKPPRSRSVQAELLRDRHTLWHRQDTQGQWTLPLGESLVLEVSKPLCPLLGCRLRRLCAPGIFAWHGFECIPEPRMVLAVLAGQGPSCYLCKEPRQSSFPSRALYNIFIACRTLKSCRQ